MARRHHRQTVQIDPTWKGIDAGRGKCALYFHNPCSYSFSIELKGNSITTNSVTFEKSTDGNTWTTWGTITGSGLISHTMEANGYLYIRNASSTPTSLSVMTGNPSEGTDVMRYYNFDVRNAEEGILLGGDIRSLLCKNYDSNSWIGWTMEPYTFYRLFSRGDDTKSRITLTQWSNGIIFTNTLNDVRFDLCPYDNPVANNCYEKMFEGMMCHIHPEPRCKPFGDEVDTQLETGALVLPKYHAPRCCAGMFSNAELCFGAQSFVHVESDTGYMKGADCCRIITMPPGTILASFSMSNMFDNDTSIRFSPIDDTIYGFASGSSEVAGTVISNHLAPGCYFQMFRGCTNLIQAPELWHGNPLFAQCYASMFYGCTNLIYPPELLATTLASQCYASMFYGCTSLEQSPTLPATTLVSGCYHQMFYGCSKLKYVVAKFTTAPSALYTQNWLYGVYNHDNSSVMGGIFVKNPSATWTTTGVNAVPTANGWKIITYDGLIFVHRSASSNWTMNLTASNSSVAQTVQYSTDGTTWTNYNTGTHPNISPGTNCYIMWRKQTSSSLGNANYMNTFGFSSENHWCFGNMSSMNNQSNYLDYSFSFKGLFYNTKIYTAPKLNFKRLTAGCYQQMFENCQNLTYAPYFTLGFSTSGSSDSMFQNMFSGCYNLTRYPIIMFQSSSWGVNTCQGMFDTCYSLHECSPIVNYLNSFGLVPGLLSEGSFKECFHGCDITLPPTLQFYGQAPDAMRLMFALNVSLIASPSIIINEMSPNGTNMLTQMFAKCTSLAVISAYFNTTPSSTYTSDWAIDVYNSGAFYKSGTWNVSGTSGIPTGWAAYQVSRPNIYNPEW